MKFQVTLWALLLATTPVVAQDAFDVEAEAAVCAACHGEDGVPVEPDYPIIWGQQYFYIYTQLRDYAAKRRDNEIMSPIAEAFDKDEAKMIAEYFAAKEWPRIQAIAEEGDEQLADRAFTSGQCSACHGKWEGDSRIPRLAGQQPGYLSQTIHDFKNDVRMNAPDLNSTMKQLDEAEIEAVSRYLAAI
jgi:cytochrome c553